MFSLAQENGGFAHALVKRPGAASLSAGREETEKSLHSHCGGSQAPGLAHQRDGHDRDGLDGGIGGRLPQGTGSEAPTSRGSRAGRGIYTVLMTPFTPLGNSSPRVVPAGAPGP
jgi:hypothetical protein